MRTLMHFNEDWNRSPLKCETNMLPFKTIKLIYKISYPYIHILHIIEKKLTFLNIFEISTMVLKY